MKKHLLLSSVMIVMMTLTGCAAAVIGAGATGGYAVATNERPVDRMMDDSTITSRINNDMIKDSVVKARQIDVDTVGGHNRGGRNPRRSRPGG